jgi:site-specific recombinase XerD
LLQDGNTLETVATLLGHTNTKVTSKSYSHWVKGRQDNLEETVKNSWTHWPQLPGHHLQITNKTKGK